MKTDDGALVECKIKGSFRLKGIRSTNPVAVGDRVSIEENREGTAFIVSIDERENYIIRKACPIFEGVAYPCRQYRSVTAVPPRSLVPSRKMHTEPPAMTTACVLLNPSDRFGDLVSWPAGIDPSERLRLGKYSLVRRPAWPESFPLLLEPQPGQKPSYCADHSSQIDIASGSSRLSNVARPRSKNRSRCNQDTGSRLAGDQVDWGLVRRGLRPVRRSWRSSFESVR